MKKIFIAVIFISIVISSCEKADSPTKPDIKIGKNVFRTTLDGTEREYIVSVPQNYDDSTPIPVVFMLHGTGGNGEKFYNISGWKEVGEQENILTVFPSSLAKCIIDGGIQKTISKWNSEPAEWVYCNSDQAPDDVRFLGQVLDELEEKYIIDTKRIYFVGFSNGGQMCAKLSILMSDRIAAIVESAASFSFDTTFVPLRKLPISFQIGNKDYGPSNVGPEIPLSEINNIINYSGYGPHNIIQTHIKSFNLNSAYTLSGDTTTAFIASYTPINGNTINNFNFAFIKGLDHAYPNGTNHWMHGAQVHWNWLRNYTLP